MTTALVYLVAVGANLPTILVTVGIIVVIAIIVILLGGGNYL